ncbi:hypothetical protein ES705_11441 [subsurface metagenome]
MPFNESKEAKNQVFFIIPPSVIRIVNPGSFELLPGPELVHVRAGDPARPWAGPRSRRRSARSGAAALPGILPIIRPICRFCRLEKPYKEPKKPKNQIFSKLTIFQLTVERSGFCVVGDLQSWFTVTPAVLPVLELILDHAGDLPGPELRLDPARS